MLKNGAPQPTLSDAYEWVGDCTGNVPEWTIPLTVSLHFGIYTWSRGILSSGSPYHHGPPSLSTGQETEGAGRGRWELARSGKIPPSK